MRSSSRGSSNCHLSVLNRISKTTKCGPSFYAPALALRPNTTELLHPVRSNMDAAFFSTRNAIPFITHSPPRVVGFFERCSNSRTLNIAFTSQLTSYKVHQMSIPPPTTRIASEIPVNGSPSPQQRCTRRAHPPPDGQSRRSAIRQNIATRMLRGAGGGKSSQLDLARRQQQQQQHTRWNGGKAPTAPGKGGAASDKGAGDTSRQDMRAEGAGGKQSAVTAKKPSDCGSHITCIAVSQWLQVPPSTVDCVV